MIKRKYYWSIPLGVFIGIICGLIYLTLTPPIYKVSGSVGIMRPTLPPVSNFMPETQNRWVWIRDGLSMKEMLLQDSILLQLIQKSDILKMRLDNYATGFPEMLLEDIMASYLNEFKNSIKIQYTGGDANIFIFTVTDENPALAKEVVSLLISQLQFIYEEIMFSRNDASLKELDAKTFFLQNSLSGRTKDSSEILLQGKISAINEAAAKLYVENVLQTIQGKMLFKTINKPYIPTHPSWPRWDLVIFFSILLGLLFGVFLHFVISRFHE